MTIDSLDIIDLEYRWLTIVENGAIDALTIRSLANRISGGDIIKKESFILGFVASQTTVDIDDQSVNSASNQMSLF
jgi:hypothetical protein